MNVATLLSRLVVPILLILPAFPATAAEPAETMVAGDSSLQMHEHLQAMDRRLRTRLLQVAGRQPLDGSAAVTTEEVQRLRRHLRGLEHRLQTWPDGAALIAKVRALQPLVDNLERAAEHPETAAGLAGLRRALRVEWPAADDGLKGAPANDDCADAIPIGDGTYFGDTSAATADGEGCSSGTPDVWFAYTSPVTAEVVADTFGSGFDTVLSLHSGCPGTAANLLDCNDNVFGLQSALSFQAQAGTTYLIRVSGSFGASGPFTLNVGLAGVIAGTVTDEATGEPVAAIEIETWDADGAFAGYAVTGPDGSYEIPGLVTGNHFVFTQLAENYLLEVYDDLPCDPMFGCRPLDGTPIPVAGGTTAGGIDFALNRGGSISGTVTEADTGSPPPEYTVMIEIWNSEGDQVYSSHVDASGDYFVGGLPAGTYHAATRGSEFLDEIYDDVPCPGGVFVGCELADGTPLELTFGNTTSGVDFALDRLGAISGTVTDAATGFPLVTADVEVLDESGSRVAFSFADGSGFYQAGGLPPGNYFVRAFERDHLPEVFDNLPCGPGCDPTIGTLVPVSLGSTTPDIDFALERLGAITGIVTHAVTGQPISGIDVTIYTDLGPVDFDTTGVAGTYFVDGLLPGTYTALASNFQYVNELYDDMPCEGDCDPATGTPIAVSLNTITGDVDFTLDRKGKVSGRITHAVTGQPLIGVNVEVYDASGALISGDSTDGAGQYVAVGLDPGPHFAVASGFEYLAELYDGMPCADGCDPTAGTPIAVNLNTATGDVDFTLDEKGQISGRALHAGQPVDGALIEIYDDAGDRRVSTFTDSQGRYVADRLLAGTYFAIAKHFELDNELYDDLPCEGGCDPTTGTPIPVSNNSATPDVDFDLGYCTPTATSLCLTGDRFRVEATWENFENDTGAGLAEGLTADSGYFWFFSPDNIELVVKVLGACTEPYNRFWVFGAGLTDVGVELVITDELTGEVESYPNPLGRTFQPITDTDAFATCDAGLVSTVAATRPPSRPAPPAAGPEKAECAPSDTGLCLSEGRFLVEARWRTPDGGSGTGQAIPLTGDSGYFWFFSPNNVEVVVKVLDACDLASFQNFWVFGAGLTDVEVTLRVTDTESGEIQEYFNPLGTAFQTITDTGHFMTCM